MSSGRSWLVTLRCIALLLLVPTPPAAAQDTDADGIADAQDDCLTAANPSQLDTNRDGYGNLCDTDYDDNGVCGSSDFGAFSAAFGSSAASPAYDPDVDADGNGGIGTSDFGVFASHFGKALGPSGLACAGALACLHLGPLAALLVLFVWFEPIYFAVAAPGLYLFFSGLHALHTSALRGFARAHAG
jgi:hypothetical protein